MSGLARFALLLLLMQTLVGDAHGQCDSSWLPITTTSPNQLVGDVTVSLSSTTNAQQKRIPYGPINGYFLGDLNSTERLDFIFNKPVARVRITGRALSAIYDKGIEAFTMWVNGAYHGIAADELTTPDPAYGRRCYLMTNGSLLGDTALNGDGSFIVQYNSSSIEGISSFGIKDSVIAFLPEGAIFQVEIFTRCPVDTPTTTTPPPDTPVVHPITKIFFPNAFTPNGDGRNDVFGPSVTGSLIKYDFAVYNRWGQIIFHNNSSSQGWDGNASSHSQGTGIYIWRCQYQFEGEPPKMQHGTIMLLR